MIYKRDAMKFCSEVCCKDPVRAIEFGMIIIYATFRFTDTSTLAWKGAHL